MAKTQPTVCPHCGCPEMDVEQYSWNKQAYDASTDEWGSCDYGDYSCNDLVIGVTCSGCDADLTDWWLLRGGMPQFVHDVTIPRRTNKMPPEDTSTWPTEYLKKIIADAADLLGWALDEQARRKRS